MPLKSCLVRVIAGKSKAYAASSKVYNLITKRNNLENYNWSRA